jgi:hypothetical protein
LQLHFAGDAAEAPHDAFSNDTITFCFFISLDARHLRLSLLHALLPGGELSELPQHLTQHQ